MAKEVQVCRNSENGAQPMDSESLDLEVPKGTTEISLDFEEWTARISEIEKSDPDDLEKICLVYDSFLSEFPLCSGYWRKYVSHKARLSTIDKVVQVFERAVESATYSLSVWIDYFTFSLSAFEDPYDIRRLFRRAISLVGKDYLCHTLWDKYIEFELSQQQWDSLALIYIQTLRFPTRKLRHYYQSFKKLTATLTEQIKSQSNSKIRLRSESTVDSETPVCYKDDEIVRIIKEVMDPSFGVANYNALQKYISIGERFYKKSCQLDEKISNFESKIRRTYFHVKPLETSQLENWQFYLDFVEGHGDFDWAVKLYERCLIPCANYPEFWMRYVEFMETKGGREIASFALERATQTFIKRFPVIHRFNARFKEQIGDVSGASNAFLQLDSESDSSFTENIIMKSNMEKRMGNFAAASNTYKEALQMASEKKMLHLVPTLYIHFSRLEYMITDNADAARDILIDGIKNVPHCRLLIEELIKFTMMHEGPRHIDVVDSIIADEISPGSDLSQGWIEKDREDISVLYLEFVDLCGTIHDVSKAWNRHMKLFPHSLRAISSNHPASGTKLLKITKEDIPTKACGYGLLNELAIENKKHSLPENKDTQTDQADDDKVIEYHDIETNQAIHQLQSEQFGEDTNTTEMTEAPPEDFKENETWQEHGSAVGQERKSLSLDSLSLDETIVVAPYTHQGPSFQKETATKLPSGKFHKDLKYEFHGRSQRNPDQVKHVSAQQHQEAEKLGPAMPHYQSNTEEQPVSSQTLPPPQRQPNVTSTSQSQLPPENSQNAMMMWQSNEQYGQMQNTQAYEQMWQYYYYNQQQLLYQQPQNAQILQQQFHEQQLQLQQHYIQLQQQIPYQNPQLQQQLYNQQQQHQYMLYLQQQQQQQMMLQTGGYQQQQQLFQQLEEEEEQKENEKAG